MASETGATEFGHESDEVGVPVHWLDGTEAQAGQMRLFEDGADEVGEGARASFRAEPLLPANLCRG